MNKEELKKNNKQKFVDNRLKEKCNIKRQLRKEKQKINKIFKEFKKEIKILKINCFRIEMIDYVVKTFLLMVIWASLVFWKDIYLFQLWGCKKKKERNGV